MSRVSRSGHSPSKKVDHERHSHSKAVTSVGAGRHPASTPWTATETLEYSGQFTDSPVILEEYERLDENLGRSLGPQEAVANIIEEMRPQKLPFNLDAIRSVLRSAFEKHGWPVDHIEAGALVLAGPQGTAKRGRPPSRRVEHEEVAGDRCLAIQPSEFWIDRDLRKKETPAAFIRRVYAQELAAGALTSRALRQADRRLYQAYESWIRPERHPEDNLQLQTERGPVFATAEEALAHKLEVARVASRAWRLRKRDISPS